MKRAVRCIVFDFDGVLVDSNRIKRRAYYDIFEGTPVTAAAIAGCLATHADGDRQDVIGCIVANLESASPAREPLVSRYVEAYKRRCDEQIAICQETPGASEVLTILAADYPLYLNSATPVESLQRYIVARRWDKLFRGLLGRPAIKLENLRTVCELEEIDSQSLLFIGDRQSDAIAARDAKCLFVGFRSDESDFTEAVDLLDTLDHLPGYLQTLEHSQC